MLPYKLPVQCCTCVPQNPFYVRWLNRYGGYDYWMFQKRQTLELSQEDVQTFSPYIANYQTAHGTDRLVSKTVEERLTIGAQQLSLHDWQVLSHIVKSPIVQYFDKERPKDDPWVDVLIDKSKVLMQTDDGAHSIELTMLLPAPRLAL